MTNRFNKHDFIENQAKLDFFEYFLTQVPGPKTQISKNSPNCLKFGVRGFLSTKILPIVKFGSTSVISSFFIAKNCVQKQKNPKKSYVAFGLAAVAAVK